MREIFQIQSIRISSHDIDPSITRIVEVLKKGPRNAEYDCFISYRVATDADLAEKLYYALLSKGYRPYLDKKCLEDGIDWKTGFRQGLIKSRFFLPLISRKGLTNIRDPAKDHSHDNVLLEYEIALKVLD
jgi:hypothetical protein